MLLQDQIVLGILTHCPLTDHGNFKCVNILMIDILSISTAGEIALRWISHLGLHTLLHTITDDKSILVQVMAWCHQATSHYLNQCWPSYMLPYGITRGQWVNSLCSMFTVPLFPIDFLSFFLVNGLVHHSSLVLVTISSDDDSLRRRFFQKISNSALVNQLAIIWTNVDLSSPWFCADSFRISVEIKIFSFWKMCL